MNEANATPHAELIADLMNPNNPKNEREQAAVREIERLRETQQAIIAGALFDFMGWLTSRKERLVLSSTDEASPAVDAITDFAKMRGLSLDDARVQDWVDAPPAAQPEQELVAWGVFEGNLHDMFFTQEEAQEMADLKGSHAEVKPLYTTPPAAQRPWQGLTDEELQFYIEKHSKLVNAGYDKMTDTNLVAKTFDSTGFYKEVSAALKERNNG